MSGRPQAAYAEIVKPRLGAAPAAGGTRRVARRAWRGLVEVLIGPDPPGVWRWRSPQERRAAYATLGVATLALCAANLVSGVATPGQLVLAVPVVAPLPLAARYPMWAWRIGWLALLLTPLAPAHWWGGWPWGPGQIFALLGAFALAGIRQQRPELWWMWALTLIPWWLWLAADIPDLAGPVGATFVSAAAAIAVDSIGFWLRAQRALAAQTERAEKEQARRAVLEERTRIARELHDVVAHHMSLIAVRAETASYRLPGLPESARAEFGSLSEEAREALAEMRRLLGVLRDDQPAALAPQPQLADLPAYSSIPPARPGYRSSCPFPFRCIRCLPASDSARTGSFRNRWPTPASTPPEPRSPCRWIMMSPRSCCVWPTGPAGTPARPAPLRTNAGQATG